MKLNEFTFVETRHLYLVPYEDFHVEKYNDWMKSQELQILTNSEPLTIEEEYACQKSWRTDEKKLTFIILSKEVYNKSNGSYQDKEINSMIGDINLFFHEGFEAIDYISAEIEVMIADPNYRKKGFGQECIVALMLYAAKTEQIAFETFSVKIAYDNVISQNLFYKLGFILKCRNDFFKEVELQLLRSDVKLPSFIQENWLLSIKHTNEIRI